MTQDSFLYRVNQGGEIYEAIMKLDCNEGTCKKIPIKSNLPNNSNQEEIYKIGAPLSEQINFFGE